MMINWQILSDPRPFIERCTAFAAKDMHETWIEGKASSADFFACLDIVFILDWQEAYRHDIDADVNSVRWRTPKPCQDA